MSTDQDPIKTLHTYTRGLLDRLDEFFFRATGCHAEGFSSLSNFDSTVKATASQIVARASTAFPWLDTEVRSFVATEGTKAFNAAQKLGGMRLVLGGSSRFQKTQFESVRSTLLYADTVLIPDPVMPWLENERKEERFRLVLLLKAVHCLLHLKPIVDADLPYPALVIFPSWEKSLEDNDEQTQNGINQLVIDVVASATRSNVTSNQEVVELTDRFPDQFCLSAERASLIVAPGGPIGEPVARALERYEEHLKDWRSSEWMEEYGRLPVQRKLLNILYERLGPIFHLRENAQEFRGHPLMCIEQQAHYFKLVSATGCQRLELLNVVKPETSAMISAMAQGRLDWLGNINTDALIALRMDNENQHFREVLGNAMSRLQSSDLDAVDLVAGEICRELDGAIAEHQREVRLIQEKYKRNHKQTLLLGAGGFGAMLMPALAPLLGTVAPFALAGKYGHDKMSELQAKQELSSSLIGVLAQAKTDG